MRHVRRPKASTIPAIDLVTALDRLCYIVEKSRECDAAADVAAPETAGDDDAVAPEGADDPAWQELAAALDLLNDDERIEVLALMWLGRGDFAAAEWADALAQARERHTAREQSYLVGTPLLADYLEEGLAQLGHSCRDLEPGPP